MLKDKIHEIFYKVGHVFKCEVMAKLDFRLVKVKSKQMTEFKIIILFLYLFHIFKCNYYNM